MILCFAGAYFQKTWALKVFVLTLYLLYVSQIIISIPGSTIIMLHIFIILTVKIIIAVKRLISFIYKQAIMLYVNQCTIQNGNIHKVQ